MIYEWLIFMTNVGKYTWILSDKQIYSIIKHCHIFSLNRWSVFFHQLHSSTEIYMFLLPWELLFFSSTKVEIEWRKDAFRKRQGSSGPI